jgi:putative ABC transport system substrate-binding protein
MQIDLLRRREFITLLGGAAVWPMAARAQQANVPVIGALSPANPEPIWDALRAGLRNIGYVEGSNIRFELRSADGKLDLLRGLADELVRLKVDVIAAMQTPAVIAARQATTEIPIVMVAGDPVGTGLISSLARPGGNITGLSGTATELGAKVVELIRDVLPSTRRVAVLANASDPFSVPFVDQIEEGGHAIGIAIQTIKVRGEGDYVKAFAAMETEAADAVILQPSLPRKRALDLAREHRLPAVGVNALVAQEGGLMSYAPDANELYYGMAPYIARILKGAKPADLPVQQPTKYLLVINLKTAKALGLTIPESVLLRADEAIE